MDTTSSPGDTATDENVPYRYGARLASTMEAKWQQWWDEQGTYQIANPVGQLAGDTKLSDNKMFIQDMFPFPSGAGLHVGHPLGYIATDVYARYHRMLGASVLHTLGYDAFGLPAEQYAVSHGVHPRETTATNIATMEKQLGRLGLGHDKRRSVSTTDEEYYRWTQWIFLKIYDSWYDESARDGVGQARPISELIAQFESSQRPLPTVAGVEENSTWSTLSPAAQQAVLNEYRLVYLSDSLVNWCPALGTVLANEEVTADGLSERGNKPVFRKHLSQWMMRITSYSDRLVDDLEHVDWSDKVKAMQRNWIGRSYGASVHFVTETGQNLEVFTTRPDTLFGATYMVIAPEHELVSSLIKDNRPWPQDLAQRAGDAVDTWTMGAESPAQALGEYVRSSANKSDVDRQENKEKTGVFTGIYATNPVDGNSIPVFVADYVLSGYGTGAIMAVPAHDERDWEFASLFNLEITEVVSGADTAVSEAAYTGSGPLVNSVNDSGLSLDGMQVAEAKQAAIAWLEERNAGTGKVQYKLRDWLFARQRYWGEPFPIVYDSDGVAHALDESMLPVKLPQVDDYQPVSFADDDESSRPSPPLNKATDWVTVELDLGDGLQTYTRDTNVMPNWAGSCWYQLRYIDPANSESLCDAENEQYWMGPRPQQHGENDPGGLDLYVGGVEHAVLHLLYARFWHKVLFDLGVVSSSEPYRRLFNQGYIQAFSYTDERGVYVPAADVVERDKKFYYPTEDGEIEVTQNYGKMGKSLKNSVSPDDMCDEYGADTLRVYEMAMGPLDASRPWATKDVVGSHRFLQRAWRVVVDEQTGTSRVKDIELTGEALAFDSKIIAGVRDDYHHLRNNTAIAKLIEYTNYLTKNFQQGAPRQAAENLVRMLSPIAPHIAEEMWQILGHSHSVVFESFPEFDPDLLVEDQVEIPVQVKGKVRGRILVAADAPVDVIEAAALADEKVHAHIDGQTIRKVIVVPGKMVNIVV